jgi:hypothetical protein
MYELEIKFINDDGEVRYRPSPDYASALAHDRLAFCSVCTQVHDDIGPNFAYRYCPDCKNDTVFGHLHFDKIV